MAARLRFYLDENVPVEVAKQLRSRGIDVVTVRDLGLLGATDTVHMAEQRARREYSAPTMPTICRWLVR